MKPPAKMTKPELLEAIAAEGVDVDVSSTNAVLAAAIEAHRAAAAETSQAEPTQAQPRDGAGRVLDPWGLPYSGPARTAALAELGKPDPNIEPEAWAVADVSPSADAADPASQQQD